jgi:Na+-translocating ferredoxin:NAD+ oxidoreductase subunit D
MTPRKKLLQVTSSPHVHSPDSVPGAMRDVLLALLPALLAGLYFFRVPALLLVLSCVGSAYIVEYLCLKAMGKQTPAKEQSAVVTGLLLAFCLPPALPLWMGALGSAFGIVIAKHLFGGLGYNIFNPALIGRCFLLASFPVAMTHWISPIDAVSTASPLGMLKESLKGPLPSVTQLLVGNVSGSLGETSAVAILLGGLYLWYRGHIDLRIPASFIGTVFALTSIIAMVTGKGISYPLFHLFAGGLFLGAFFMATDWVTTPVTQLGRILFGIGCGSLVVLIRVKGGYPEGVAYSILLMNIVTPLLDRYTKARVFGREQRNG